MRDFVFRQSYYEGIKNMGDEDKVNILALICAYGVNGEIPTDFPKVGDYSFFIDTIKGQIDRSCERHKKCVENGKKGGRPKKKAEIEIDTVSVFLPNGERNPNWRPNDFDWDD